MREFKGYQKGVNLGGWLSQCDYSDDRLENFIKEEDIKTIKGWGADHVRVPVDYNIFQDQNGAFIDRGFICVDRAIEWCGKYGLNMILDLHKTEGYSFDPGHNEVGFFANEKYQEQYYDLWKEFSKRYGQYSDRVAFELLNEVTDKSYCETWNKIIKKVIPMIRENAKDTSILVGGYWNNAIEAIKDLDEPYDDKVVYTFHCYEPITFTHQRAYWIPEMPKDFTISYPDTLAEYRKRAKETGLDKIQNLDGVDLEAFSPEFFGNKFKEAIEIADERNVPLYCGEYGVIELAKAADTLHWFKDINAAFDQYKIGRAVWSYKEMDFGVTGHTEPEFADAGEYFW